MDVITLVAVAVIALLITIVISSPRPLTPECDAAFYRFLHKRPGIASRSRQLPTSDNTVIHTCLRVGRECGEHHLIFLDKQSNSASDPVHLIVFGILIDDIREILPAGIMTPIRNSSPFEKELINVQVDIRPRQAFHPE